MSGTPLVVVVLLTSLGAGVVGMRTGALHLGRWPLAARHTLEVFGLGLMFFVLNVALLAGGAIALRSLGGAFVSVYAANDFVLVGLAVLQGVLFGAWRRSTLADRTPNRREPAIAPS